VSGTEQRVLEILEHALKTPLAGEEPLSRDHLERWDSLKHIEIMFMLEEEFDVEFSEEELAGLRDIAGIVHALESRHAT